MTFVSTATSAEFVVEPTPNFKVVIFFQDNLGKQSLTEREKRNQGRQTIDPTRKSITNRNGA